MVCTRSQTKKASTMVEETSQAVNTSGLEEGSISYMEFHEPTTGIVEPLVVETVPVEPVSLEASMLDAGMEEIRIEEADDEIERKKGKKILDVAGEMGEVSISFHLDMLSVTLEQLHVRRDTPPPLVPLCHVIQHKAIRTVGEQRYKNGWRTRP
ncbi:hypothetical protein O6H91_17G055400 [Diphasiastrum complanatum]|uniref:Uncharacterized protein n=1 Tax=Diphasiastrum complanatum TaxID=34168 RepID=A0ACC2B6Z1_DIPCM|nr:hypothetical protein O6H91_17G055400 [Diphasiastrum complanatum]